MFILMFIFYVYISVYILVYSRERLRRVLRKKAAVVIHLHSLTSADLHLHTFTSADLHLHTLTSADLHLHTLTSADLHQSQKTREIVLKMQAFHMSHWIRKIGSRWAPLGPACAQLGPKLRRYGRSWTPSWRQLVMLGWSWAQIDPDGFQLEAMWRTWKSKSVLTCGNLAPLANGDSTWGTLLRHP